MEREESGVVTSTVAPLSAADVATQPRVIVLRRVLFALYAVGLAAVIYVWGVPTSRVQLMGMAILSLATASLGRGWRAIVQLLLDWLPFTGALMLYDLSRSLGHSLGMPLHESDIVSWESGLFGGTVPSVWLQDHLYSPHTVHWYDALTTVVYTTHFLATPVLAAVLWWRDRPAWIGYTVRVVVLAVVGVLTYILFPEAPPWMAAQDGYIPPVERLSARGWIWFHLPNVHELLEKAQNGGSNPVAAMPSLHMAFACLVALAIANRIQSRWRVLMALYPAAMGFSLVYLGEHWVIDLAAGVGYALAVNWVVGVWEQNRATADADADAGTGSDHPDGPLPPAAAVEQPA